MNEEFQKLTKSEVELLQYITKIGPVHGYFIKKEPKIIYSDKTIYSVLNNLKENKMLEKKSPKERKRPGQPIKKYYLTPIGLMVSLGINENLWKIIDKISVTWKTIFPLIFSRWEKFRKSELYSEAKKALKDSIEDKFLDWKYKHRNDNNSVRSSVEDSFLQHFFSNSIPIEVFKKWNQMIKIDPELRKKQEEYSQRQIKIAQALEKSQKLRLQIIEKLKDPDHTMEEIEDLEAKITIPYISLNQERENES